MFFFSHATPVSSFILLLHVTSAGRDCFLKDVLYPPQIDTSLGATSPEGCQINCAAHPECKFWSYKTTGECFLNKGFAGQNGFVANVDSFGIVSGPKFGCHGGECFLRDALYPAQIHSNLGASSAEHCQEICASNFECQLWSYKPTGECFMNKGHAGPNEFEVVEGIVSGPRVGCHVATLRAAAARTGVYLGAAMNDFALASDGLAAAIHANEFNFLTAENGCKWEKVEPVEQGQYDFTQCDAQYEHALRNGQEFRWHATTWGNQLPGWLLRGGFNGEQKAAILVNHIKTMIARYPDAIWWDVVNEAIDDQPRRGLKTNFWFPDVPNYVELSFRTAREANPNLKLMYNDYLAETRFHNSKSDDVFELATKLKSAGLLDGIGFQAHFPLGFIGAQLENVRANMKRYEEIGLEVHITELDIGCVGFSENQSDLQSCPGWGKAQEIQQAEEYRKWAQLCLEEPACTCFETWGFSDRYTWLTPDITVSNNHPLLWDEFYQKKLAYTAVIETFQAAKGAGCVERDVLYLPQIASNRNAASVKHCQQICAEHAECNNWTFQSTGECFLNRDGSSVSPIRGLVSGPKMC